MALPKFGPYVYHCTTSERLTSSTVVVRNAVLYQKDTRWARSADPHLSEGATPLPALLVCSCPHVTFLHARFFSGFPHQTRSYGVTICVFPEKDVHDPPTENRTHVFFVFSRTPYLPLPYEKRRCAPLSPVSTFRVVYKGVLTSCWCLTSKDR